MHSDFKLPKDVAGYLERMFAASRERRRLAESRRPEIQAAEDAQRKAAEEALEAGRIRHLGTCGVPEKFLEAFRGELKQTPALVGVRSWLKQERPFLLLTGGYGSGKTVAAASALLQARRTVSAHAHELSDEPVTWEEYDRRGGFFVTAAQLHFAKRYEDDRSKTVLDLAATVRWLVLDELREADGRGAGQERLEEVLNERYARRLRTVITSNMGPDALRLVVGERLASRFAECLYAFDVGDDDLRRQR